MEAGEIAGISIAVIALCASIPAFVFLYLKRKESFRCRKDERRREDVEFTNPAFQSRPLDDRPPIATAKTRKNDINKPPLTEKDQEGHPASTWLAVDNLPDGFSGRDISVKDFAKYVSFILRNDKPFAEEYESLPMNLPYSQDCAVTQGEKNRYKDILPYDYNRVVLSLLPSDPNSHYINASRVLALDPTRRFIASMGPKPNTVDDFWRMIWEQNVHLVVMVTNLEERDPRDPGKMKQKCAQYWPEEGSKCFGGIQVRIEQSRQNSMFALREMTISKGSEKRLLIHLQYLDWPDHGAPRDPTAMLTFLRVMGHYMVKNSPTIVHCSAGVGRTGTVIVLDALIGYAREHGTVNIYGLVEHLRHQRCLMVQALAQYEFIHFALARQFMDGDTFIPKSDFGEYYENLLADGNKRLLDQYSMLENIRMRPDIEEGYVIKNKSGGTALNGIYVDGYREKKEYIVAQIPQSAEKPVLDFWQMITETRSKTLIYLVNADERVDLPNFLPTPRRSLPIRGGNLVLKSKEEKGPHSISRVHLVDPDDKVRSMSVYEISVALDEVLDVKGLSDLYLNIASLRIGSEVPTIVACMNGALYSGQFVVCSNIFDMMLMDEKIDIYQMALMARLKKNNFIETPEQYKGLYNKTRSFLE